MNFSVRPEDATSSGFAIPRCGAAGSSTGCRAAWPSRRSGPSATSLLVPSEWEPSWSATPSSSTAPTPRKRGTCSRCSRGELFAAEALTEPRGGSDFFGATTTAEDKGDHFVLNGQKRFIVGAEGADFFLVYARSNTDAKPHEGITSFIVDRGPGVTVEYLYGLMGSRGGGTGRVRFRDVEVPKENVVGRVNGGVGVFNTMMVPERLGTAAMTIGPAVAALEVAGGYTTRRKAFGQRINRFEGVSFQVAEASMLLDASRSLVYTTARAVDAGENSATTRRYISETKKFVTESCEKVVHNAMQVMGGIGYTDVYPVERHYRDLRLAPIWTGTNEVMSMIIAHEWYREYAEQVARRRAARTRQRDLEADAVNAEATEEKVYE